MSAAALPSDLELEDLVRESLSSRFGTSRISVLERTVVGQGSFPKEVLRLAVGDEELDLFCKYEGGFEHSAHGHRGGVSYEARVYEDILGPGGYTTPEAMLVHRPPGRSDTWLFVEFLSRALRVSKATDPHAMAEAAAWVGRFHRGTTGAEVSAFIKRYGRDYYMGWVERTDAHVREAGGVDVWWQDVLRGFEEHLHLLEDFEPSMLHGEYYPKNVLWSRGRVSPVDWESAAFGAGVIDLVSLLDGWPESADRVCTDAYVRARWPSGAPEWFGEQRSLAEMYLHFRWLGEERNPAARSGLPAREWRRVRRIRELAAGLGWL